MTGQVPPLSDDATEVLEKMRTGLVLVGNIGDYGRDFRLMERNATTWENVRFGIAAELIEGRQIRYVATVGTQSEYEPA